MNESTIYRKIKAVAALRSSAEEQDLADKLEKGVYLDLVKSGACERTIKYALELMHGGLELN